MEKSQNFIKELNNAKLHYIICCVISLNNTSGLNSIPYTVRQAHQHVIYLCQKANINGLELISLLDEKINRLKNHPDPVTHIFKSIVLLSNTSKALDNMSTGGQLYTH